MFLPCHFGFHALLMLVSVCGDKSFARCNFTIQLLQAAIHDAPAVLQPARCVSYKTRLVV